MKEKANRYWPLGIWKQRYVYQDYNFSAVQKGFIYIHIYMCVENQKYGLKNWYSTYGWISITKLVNMYENQSIN